MTNEQQGRTAEERGNIGVLVLLVIAKGFKVPGRKIDNH